MNNRKFIHPKDITQSFSKLPQLSPSLKESKIVKDTKDVHPVLLKSNNIDDSELFLNHRQKMQDFMKKKSNDSNICHKNTQFNYLLSSNPSQLPKTNASNPSSQATTQGNSHGNTQGNTQGKNKPSFIPFDEKSKDQSLQTVQIHSKINDKNKQSIISSINNTTQILDDSVSAK
jgi:hypothetical protein